MDAGTKSKPLVPKAGMITIRFTKKLLRRFGASRPAGIAPMDTTPTARLGDWHANVLYRPNAELVMFVNDRSLLPVVVPARPTDIVAMRLVEALATTRLRPKPARTVSRTLQALARVCSPGRIRTKHFPCLRTLRGQIPYTRVSTHSIRILAGYLAAYVR